MNLHLYYGELAAIFTLLCWTVTALAFEAASKKVGSLTVNLYRLVIAFILLSVLNLFHRGMPFPSDANTHEWLWLSISGIIGLVIGDYFLFKSFVYVGARVSMLIMTLVPPISAFTGWLLMNERLSFFDLLGMAVSLTGILVVILQKNGETVSSSDKKRKMLGIIFALGGAIGQAVGLVFSKYGMGEYDAFAASQIRVLTGVAGFALLITLLKRWPKIIQSAADIPAMKLTATGAFFGPFLGISFSLFAVQHTSTGVASTIMAMVPLTIILPSIYWFRHKVTVRDIVGAVFGVMGVVLLFL